MACRGYRDGEVVGRRVSEKDQGRDEENTVRVCVDRAAGEAEESQRRTPVYRRPQDGEGTSLGVTVGTRGLRTTGSPHADKGELVRRNTGTQGVRWSIGRSGVRSRLPPRPVSHPREFGSRHWSPWGPDPGGPGRRDPDSVGFKTRTYTIHDPSHPRLPRCVQ